ncbi:MAG: MFS transporter [Dehalococcoidales bacterium]|nr:MFS transporter [Dehalococcoidales bacterium]
MFPQNEPQPRASRVFYGWWVALSCILITFINGSIFFSYGIFFKPVAFDFGWSRSEFAITYGIMLAAYAPGSYFAGKLADRFSPRKVMLIAALLIGIGYLFCARAQNLATMVLGYAILGAGLGSTLTLPTATIQRWFINLRGTMLGAVNAGMGIGGLVFAPLANWLIAREGWRTSYLIIGIFFGATIALAAFLLVSEPRKMNLTPYGYNRDLSHGLFSKGSEGTPASLNDAFHLRAFWIMSALYITSFIPSFFISTHLVPYVTDRGISAAVAAQGVGLLAAVSAGGRMLLNWLAGKIGWTQSLILCYAVATAAVVSLAFINSTITFYLFALAYGLSWGSTISLLGGMAANLFGLMALSELLGFLLGIATLAGAPIPWLGGVVFDKTNTYIPAILFAAACYGIAVVLSWSLKSKKK